MDRLYCREEVFPHEVKAYLILMETEFSVVGEPNVNFVFPELDRRVRDPLVLLASLHTFCLNRVPQSKPVSLSLGSQHPSIQVYLLDVWHRSARHKWFSPFQLYLKLLPGTIWNLMCSYFMPLLKWDLPQLLNVLPFSPPSLTLYNPYTRGRFSEILCGDYKGNKQIMEK